MEPENERRSNSGRFLVAAFLAIVGLVFGVDAALAEPSATRVAFIVIAVLLIAGAGATFAVALASGRKGKE